MVIDNPVVLPAILLALLVGIGLCLYVILRFLRNLGGSAEKSAARRRTTRAGGNSEAEGPDTAQRLVEWAGGPANATEQPPASPDPSSGVPQPEGEVMEVFRVLRIGPLGELAVEVNGRRYDKITQIRDGTVGRRVLLAIQELGDFVGPHGQKPLPEMHRLSTPPASVPVGPSLPSGRDLGFLGELEGAPSVDQSAEQRVDLVGYWRKGLGSALRRGSPEQSAGPKSFIDEIEDLLQLRLANRPDLAPRGIHFRSTATGELRIEADDRLYDQIDGIPEPEIVAFLKETIQAWEQR